MIERKENIQIAKAMLEKQPPNFDITLLRRWTHDAHVDTNVKRLGC